jgi:hypothetical protein
MFLNNTMVGRGISWDYKSKGPLEQFSYADSTRSAARNTFDRSWVSFSLVRWNDSISTGALSGMIEKPSAPRDSRVLSS